MLAQRDSLDIDSQIHNLFHANCRIINDAELCGAENMQRDEANAQSLLTSQENTIFIRLYAWNPWTISLGKHQKEDDINTHEVQQRGWHIVRRATGGRAVLHANEITYSIALRLPQGINQHDVYRYTHTKLRDAFLTLGAESLDFQKTQPRFATTYKESPSAAICFASSARYEIEHNGNKVVGSAQRLFGSVLLQHGSILLDSGHEQLAYCLANKTPEQQEQIRTIMLQHSATLRQACKREISYNEVADAMRSVFTA